MLSSALVVLLLGQIPGPGGFGLGNGANPFNVLPPPFGGAAPGSGVVAPPPTNVAIPGGTSVSLPDDPGTESLPEVALGPVPQATSGFLGTFITSGQGSFNSMVGVSGGSGVGSPVPILPLPSALLSWFNANGTGGSIPTSFTIDMFGTSRTISCSFTPWTDNGGMSYATGPILQSAWSFWMSLCTCLMYWWLCRQVWSDLARF